MQILRDIISFAVVLFTYRFSNVSNGKLRTVNDGSFISLDLYNIKSIYLLAFNDWWIKRYTFINGVYIISYEFDPFDTFEQPHETLSFLFVLTNQIKDILGKKLTTTRMSWFLSFAPTKTCNKIFQFFFVFFFVIFYLALNISLCWLM
jgi:hypothetical protein